MLGLGLQPNSKEFSLVMRGLEIQRQLALQKIVNYVSFPVTSSGADRYSTTTGGNTGVDFSQGTVKTPTANYLLEGTLETCRSLLLFCSDADARIYLNGKEFINDHSLWHLFQDINVNKLQINFPTSASNQTPLGFAFGFVASDKPNMVCTNSLFVAHDVRTVTGTTTTNSFVTTVARHIAGYSNCVLTTSNTGSNSIDLTVEYSADGTTYYPVSGYTSLAVASGITNELDISVLYHFIRARIKSTSSGFHSTVDNVLQVSR
jgi:hypothetical protein